MIAGPESTSALVRQWRDYAFEAHGDQLYGNGPRLQTEHLDEGATLTESLGYPTIMVAGYYLHDVDEDTEVEMEEMQTALSLPFYVVRGLAAVTSSRHEPWRPKMDRAVSDPLGQVWKFIDAGVNLSSKVHKPDLGQNKRLRSMRKYAYFIGRAEQDLPTPHAIREFIAGQKRIESASK